MTPPSGATVDLHDQVIRQNCRTLKTPAIAAQYQGLAEAAAREGHSHVRYLLTAGELRRSSPAAIEVGSLARYDRLPPTMAGYDRLLTGREAGP